MNQPATQHQANPWQAWPAATLPAAARRDPFALFSAEERKHYQVVEHEMGRNFLGQAAWFRVLKDSVVTLVPLPSFITPELLTSRCPTSNDGSLIKDTHLLVYVPTHVRGKRFTPRTLYRGAHHLFDKQCDAWQCHPLFERGLEVPEWALIPRVDPTTPFNANAQIPAGERVFRGKSRAEQAIVLRRFYGKDYCQVKPLELLTAMVLDSLCNKRRVEGTVYLRCDESLARGMQVNIGRYEDPRAGITVSLHDPFKCPHVGMGLRRIPRGDTADGAAPA